MRVGSLFTGYGGLDMAVGGDLAWYSEIDPAACRVLAAHHPGVPNLGDITLVDWARVEPVDVLLGGYPCQPFSAAGQRKGTTDERHLWPYVRAAMATLRPMVTIVENVGGHRTLGLDVVLGDIAADGGSARWTTLRAADAGAPHGRERLFIAAYPHRDPVGPVPPGRGLLGQGTDERGEGPRVLSPVHGPGTPLLPDAVRPELGPFHPACTHWERIVGRRAPTPLLNGALSPLFVEWAMGLPEGHVTGHGLTDEQALRMLGNGVVPQQARLALDVLGVAL